MTAFSRSRLPRVLLASLLPFLTCTVVQAQQAVAPSQTAAQSRPIDRIAAVVNEDIILRSELDRAIANIHAQYADRANQLPPPDVLERQVLERLILQRLQVARAAEVGITANEADLQRAVQGVAQQNGMSVDQLRQRITQDGLSFAEFRSNLRDEIITQKLRQSFAQGRINVSEAEVDAAMANTSADATQQFHLAHILIATPENASPEQIATAQKKIEGVKSLIDSGQMNFSAAAVRYSDSPNALEGGDLGWRSLNEIPPAFAAAITQMQDGQMIGPVRGPSGFQLLQRIETRTQAAGSGEKLTQFSARQILVKVDDKTSDAAAKSEIDTIAARLAGGADFAELASEHSDDTTTRRRGGDLGWFAADTYGTAFGMHVAALNDGQTSAPFKTEAGWVIVRRTGTRQISADEQNRRAQVRDTIGRRKLEEEWNRWLQEMRGDAFVEVRGTAKADAPANGG